MFKIETKEGAVVVGYDEGDGVQGFCALDALFDFYEEYDEDDDEYPDLVWGRGTPKVVPKNSNVFKEIVRDHLRDGVLFAGDRRGGVFDTHVFPHVPKTPFYLIANKQKWRINATLSPYYRNSNSGSLVRHLTVIMQKARKGVR